MKRKKSEWVLNSMDSESKESSRVDSSKLYTLKDKFIYWSLGMGLVVLIALILILKSAKI